MAGRRKPLIGKGRRFAAPGEGSKGGNRPAALSRIERRETPSRREAVNGYWLYGRHAVAAALGNAARRVSRMLALPEAAAEAAALLAAAFARRPEAGLEIVAREAFLVTLPSDAVHQGLALLVEPLPAIDLDDLLDALPPAPVEGLPQLVLALDRVSDPHNIGAVLRSAAAFGALAVILPEHGTPPVTGTLAKAASGGLEHVPLIRVVNLARSLDRLKAAGFWCIGLAETADRTLASLRLGGRMALVLGAEGEGLRRLVRERCDVMASLRTQGAIASLNVSNAAAVALYELTRAVAAPAP